MSKKSICLNMIVKNESHVIIQTLTNLCSHIDFSYWVICDTGSTDNTKELICDFFKGKNIKGELFQHEWKDFGHNRSFPLPTMKNSHLSNSRSSISSDSFSSCCSNCSNRSSISSRSSRSSRSSFTS
jgi:hypothetical protein